jgi:beta-glucosidase
MLNKNIKHCKMRKKLLTLTLLCLTIIVSAQVTEAEFDSYDLRARDLVSQMTLEEKVLLMEGNGDEIGYPSVAAIERLGIPIFKIEHGPHGFKGWVNGKFTIGTYFPTSSAMAATWDKEMVYNVSKSFGNEMRAAAGHLNAGPSMNIVRNPITGRSFEYFTEDPYLNGRMAVAYTQGIQSEKVIADLKHYICNNQELDRHDINVTVGERALREIYLPGFKAAIQEGGAWSIMSSYNSINGEFGNENLWLQKTILVDEWGFKGFVISDWGGTHSTVPSVKAGLSIEMPRSKVYGQNLLNAVNTGEVSVAEIDELVVRFLRGFIWTGALDNDIPVHPEWIKSQAKKNIAREAATKAMVLLKNDNNTLPFDKAVVQKLAIIGPNGEYGDHYNGGEYTFNLFQGGGSSKVKLEQNRMVTPYKGITELLGNDVDVSFAPGCYAETGTGPMPLGYIKIPNGAQNGFLVSYYNNRNFSGTPSNNISTDMVYKWGSSIEIPELEDDPVTRFSVRFQGQVIVPETKDYTLELRHHAGSAKLYINDVLVKETERASDVYFNTMYSMRMEVGMEYKIRVDYVSGGRNSGISFNWDYENDAYLQEALALAAESDAVILTVGFSGDIGESEAADRQRLALYPAQERLIKAISEVNPNCVVAIVAGSSVEMDNWIEDVPSVLMSWYSGEQMGYAMHDILFGDVNPSGKLPVTFPKTYNDYPDGFYSTNQQINYDEGIYVGYRYFDHHEKEVLFPFGYGLSYTTFDYNTVQSVVTGSVENTKVEVTINITNSGDVAGEEVVQLYVNDMTASVDRPIQELKGFTKVHLNAGETKEVTITLDPTSLAFFDMDSKQWKMEAGDFELRVGSSSRDIRLQEIITIGEDYYFMNYNKNTLSSEQSIANNAVNLRVYPNPSRESITFELNNFENTYDIHIYDVLGRSVSKMENCTTNSVNFHRKGLENGLYLYQVVSGTEIISTGKFILN